jgi:hypothetical protein
MLQNVSHSTRPRKTIRWGPNLVRRSGFVVSLTVWYLRCNASRRLIGSLCEQRKTRENKPKTKELSACCEIRQLRHATPRYVLPHFFLRGRVLICRVSVRTIRSVERLSDTVFCFSRLYCCIIVSSWVFLAQLVNIEVFEVFKATKQPISKIIGAPIASPDIG